jgi:hypothetical protein
MPPTVRLTIIQVLKKIISSRRMDRPKPDPLVRIEVGASYKPIADFIPLHKVLTFASTACPRPIFAYKQ